MKATGVRTKLVLLGIAALAVTIPAALWVVRAREASRRVVCTGRLWSIGLAARMYEVDHSNNVSIWQPLSNYVGWRNTDMFICPSSEHLPGSFSNVNVWADYILVSGVSTAAPSGTVLAYCSPTNHGGEGGNILFIDGHVEWVETSRFWTTVSRGKE